MLPYFAELGRTVRERWIARNFAPDAFPEIACAVLEEKPPAGQVQLADLVQEFLTEDDQPFQTSSGFGQPELVVFDDPRFYIQILFWLEGTTDIHQHQFSGAFHVMQGSSIHSRFRFEDRQPISAHLQTGTLQMRELALLETGRTVPIVSGPEYIHALFHLEMPSITVVVRTHHDAGPSPQWTYLPPHIAVDPFHHDALTMRRKQLLDVLERTGDPAYAGHVFALLETLDFERGFFTLQNCLGHLRALGVWEEACAVFQKKHGALADAVVPTLEEIIWRDSLVGLRQTTEDPEQRFFLALLLNVSDGENVLRLIAGRFPGEPLPHVARWLEELSDSPETEEWLISADIPALNSLRARLDGA